MGIAAASLALAVSAGAALAQPTVAGCQVFPADNAWNTPIDGLPVDPMSDAYVATIGADTRFQADFGAGLYEGRPIGVPFTVVPPDQREIEIHFEAYDGEDAIEEESDVGLYAIPRDAPIEGGLEGDGDRHVIVVQQQSCTLFELYKAVPNDDGSWNAVSAVRFDLESNALRTDGWTSADAAGLPIFPGWCATTRWRRARSRMRSASRCPTRGTNTCGRRGTRPRSRTIRRCPRWASASGSRRISTSPASRPRCR
ncbi:MAG: hypothetical protein WDN31_11940 [Hyphomicrobium sp.]